MSTAIIDNSLCTRSIRDNTSPRLIKKYIAALAEAGVKYVELDFRAVMRLKELPEGMKYIFRLVDPTFVPLADEFDFDYVVVAPHALREEVTLKRPVMMELPVIRPTEKLISIARRSIKGEVAALRLRGSFPYMAAAEIRRFEDGMRKRLFLPVDFCPMNDRKAALNTAVCLMLFGARSITLSMGYSERYTSLEELVLTLLSVFGYGEAQEMLPGVCRAAVYHRMLFNPLEGETENSVSRIVQLIDSDISGLIDVDTGLRKDLRVTYRNSRLLRREFATALQQMISDEDIPEEASGIIQQALESFEPTMYDSDIIRGVKRGFLN